MPLFGRKKATSNGDSARDVAGRGDAVDSPAAAFAPASTTYGSGTAETVERVPRTGFQLFGRRNSQHGNGTGADEAVSPPPSNGLGRRDSASRRRAAPAATPTSFVTQTIGVRLRIRVDGADARLSSSAVPDATIGARRCG